jgi:hypothetical protein
METLNFSGAEKLIDTASGVWRSQILSTAIEVGLYDFIGED